MEIRQTTLQVAQWLIGERLGIEQRATGNLDFISELRWLTARNLTKRGEEDFAVRVKRNDALIIRPLRFVQPTSFDKAAQNQTGLARKRGSLSSRVGTFCANGALGMFSQHV